jgi:hypothetical protein
METYLERKESTPVEMANIAAHPELPNEQAEVGTVRVLEDRYADWHLAIGHHQALKKQTQKDEQVGHCLQTTHMSFLHRTRDMVIMDKHGQCCKRSP